MAFMYIIPIFFLIAAAVFSLFVLAHLELAFIAVVIGIFIWFIQLIHCVINLLQNPTISVQSGEELEASRQKKEESDRLFITFMSLIPGLGHMQLGLMNRGLTLMTLFFGLITMVIFTVAVTGRGIFIAFLGLLPIIWIFNLFDVTQFLNKKGKGEEIIDRSILDDIEENRIGRKSKPIAMLFAIFPGAGHLYLGLQQRGIQLMALFLVGLFLIDLLRLSMFMFLIPIIWFFSFFDALQKVGQYDQNLEDVPVFTVFRNYQKWLGIGAILLGVYYLLDQVLINAFGQMFYQYFQMDLRYWFYNYFQTFIVCTLLICAGIYLLAGKKKSASANKGEV
ncbi:hypothetical protein BTS2_2416 [Bacillus sp. TS-2]|nr:hypothetical protein BTS2_2416 [Bacillus sp. TS-2]